jgi:outer membrane receptor protein involved in Fe transport
MLQKKKSKGKPLVNDLFLFFVIVVKTILLSYSWYNIVNVTAEYELERTSSNSTISITFKNLTNKSNGEACL